MHGTVPAGTAKITIDGHDAGTSNNVQCAQITSLTTIAIGDDQPRAQVQLSDAAGLTVEAVRIKGFHGFDGSYDRGLGGHARVNVVESTYNVSGTADGFDTDNPNRVHPTDFTISVAC
jgi:hypothetical protein